MASKIIIVDENDKIIGFKDRDAVKQQDIYRVSALWITNGKGGNLMSHRTLTRSHDPGKWVAAVTGTVEEGEDYEINIIKEAEEEIGLKNISPTLGPKVRVTDEHNFFVQWFIFELDKSANEFILQKDEVDEIKWFSNDEIKKDLQANPDKFVKTMKRWVEIFCK